MLFLAYKHLCILSIIQSLTNAYIVKKISAKAKKHFVNFAEIEPVIIAATKNENLQIHKKMD